MWRGAFGSRNDSFVSPDVAAEAAAYSAFIASASAKPRYRTLNFGNKIGEGQTLEYRPNLRLGLIRMRQQVKRIARQIFETASREKIRAGVRAMLLCAPVASMPVVLNPAIHTQIETNLNRLSRCGLRFIISRRDSHLRVTFADPRARSGSLAGR